MRKDPTYFEPETSRTELALYTALINFINEVKAIAVQNETPPAIEKKLMAVTRTAEKTLEENYETHNWDLENPKGD